MSVEVYTDSRSMVDAFPKALTTWQSGNFDHVPQGEVWREVARLARGMRVTLKWVKSHQEGDSWEARGNRKADELANKGREMAAVTNTMDKTPLPVETPDDTLPEKEEILLALRELNGKGAPGIDGISGEELQGTDEMRTALVTVIRTAWETGIVPKDWTVAKLIAIPKKSGAVEWSSVLQSGRTRTHVDSKTARPGTANGCRH